jgi:hydroxymethylpyrimidine pyrophosphatase-like HAD family hydrolase
LNSHLDINKYKLVISDLDGTILESGQPIHPFTKDVFAKLPGLGIQFTLASGRSLASLRPYAEELNIERLYCPIAGWSYSLPNYHASGSYPESD